MWEDTAVFFAMGFFYASLIPIVFSARAKKLHLHPITIVISIVAEFLFLISFISFGLAISSIRLFYATIGQLETEP